MVIDNRNDDRSQPNIVPFGKHKGKTVEEVLESDPKYAGWLAGQDWFRDRHVILYQTIINRGAEPEETPDHNALQVLFLDDAFCLKVVAAAGIDLEKRFTERKNKEIRNIEAVLKERHWRLECHLREGPRGTRYSVYNNDTKQVHQKRIVTPENLEYFDSHKNRLEKDADAAVECLEKEQAKSFRLAIAGRQFEHRGIDVTFHALADPYASVEINIEIKPSVGDDFPAVLRQMKRTNANILFLEHYTGAGATIDQFIAIFKAAEIAVVFRHQVERNLDDDGR